jgi:hypothetical protein
MTDDWRQRVVNERDELADRLARLDGFLLSSNRADVLDCGLLEEQRVHMRAYLGVLDQRIEAFE